MVKGRVIMFCTNCGNMIDEDTYICVNCGMILKKRSDNVFKKKNNGSVLGIISMIFGFISMILSFMLFFHNISSVGMYTEIYERIFYALEYCLSPILMAIVTLIFSLVSKKNCYSSVGIALSVLSFFFIITEIIVVVIY